MTALRLHHDRAACAPAVQAAALIIKGFGVAVLGCQCAQQWPDEPSRESPWSGYRLCVGGSGTFRVVIGLEGSFRGEVVVTVGAMCSHSFDSGCAEGQRPVPEVVSGVAAADRNPVPARRRSGTCSSACQGTGIQASFAPSSITSPRRLAGDRELSQACRRCQTIPCRHRAAHRDLSTPCHGPIFSPGRQLCHP